MILKIISGGQTGADLGGLRAAIRHGIPTGGCAAKGFMTEDGVFPELKTFYLLHDSGYGYVERTNENVRESDLTLIYADNLNSAGTKLTIDSCNKHKKPYKVNLPAYALCDLLKGMDKILPSDKEFVVNVAGNRESVAPGIRERTERVVGEGLKMYKFLEKPEKKKIKPVSDDGDDSW